MATICFKIQCTKCGAKYWTDKARAERVKKILETQPDYLTTYVCSKCVKNGNVAQAIVSKPVKAVKPKTPEIEEIKPVLVEKSQKQAVEPVNMVVCEPEPVKADTLPDIDEDDVSQYVPPYAEEYINRKIGGVKDEDILMYHLKSENPLMKNVLLIGQTGTGKSVFVKWFASKHKIPYYRIVMNAGTTKEDIVGQMIMTETGKFKFSYQVLIKLMQKGGIVVFDEINAGQKELLHILNGLTDWERRISVTENKGEVVYAKSNFLVVASCNPPDEYDLQEMSKSLKSRFCTYYFNYDDKIDAKILGKKEEKLMAFAVDVRVARNNHQLETPLSTRDLLQFKTLRDDLGYDTAKEMLISKFNNGEQSVIRTLIETHMEKSKILDNAPTGDEPQVN